MQPQKQFDRFANRPTGFDALPDTGIGFARSGDKTGALTNRQCKKCGGRTSHTSKGFYCDHCGYQGER